MKALFATFIKITRLVCNGQPSLRTHHHRLNLFSYGPTLFIEEKY